MSSAKPESAGIAPSRQLAAGLVLALANFMVILDLTIANVSINARIQGNGLIPPRPLSLEQALETAGA